MLPYDVLYSGMVKYQRSELAFLHPMQSADIWVGEQKIGYLGQLHPQIAQTLALPTTWVAQLDLVALLKLHTTHKAIATPSRFPQVRRDFAVLVDEAVLWQQLSDTIFEQAGKWLQDMWLFDVYQGDNLPDGKHSLAFALVWQDDKGTLSDEQINQISEQLIATLKVRHNATLR